MMTEKEWKRIAIRRRVSEEVEERVRSSKVLHLSLQLYL